jgi:hypothetical protein
MRKEFWDFPPTRNTITAVTDQRRSASLGLLLSLCWR